jgi:hypothetical protein
MQTIFVEPRNNYGATVFYPANEAAQLFADIAGTKTLSMSVIQKAKQLGFLIEVKQQVFTL